MRRFIPIVAILTSLLTADSFEERMITRGDQIQSIPNTFGGKEFGQDTWLFNVIEKNCQKSIGKERTECLLKNRKSILDKWAKTDEELLRIAQQNNDSIVWIAQQEYNLDSYVESLIEGKYGSTNTDKKIKGTRLPTLQEITKACYDKNLRQYFYGSTTGYNNDNFHTNFEYQGEKNMYLDFKTCKPIYLANKYREYKFYGQNFSDLLVATKYVRDLK